MKVNYLSAVHSTRAVLQSMVNRKVGHVVFVSSQGGQVGLQVVIALWLLLLLFVVVVVVVVCCCCGCCSSPSYCSFSCSCLIRSILGVRLVKANISLVVHSICRSGIVKAFVPFYVIFFGVTYHFIYFSFSIRTFLHIISLVCTVYVLTLQQNLLSVA